MSTRQRSSQGITRAALRPRVELPPAGSEQLNPRTLIAIALASAAAGIALVQLLAARDESAARAAEAAPAAIETNAAPIEDERPAAAGADAATAAPSKAIAAPSQAIAAPPQATPAPSAPEVAALFARDEGAVDRAPASAPPPAPVASAPAQRQSELAATTPVRSEPAAGAESEPTVSTGGEPAGVNVVPGHVAYLRCDGLATKGGAFPCPRDRALEKSLRAIVAALDRCSEAAALGRGEFELRIELSAARARPDLDIRAPTEAGKKAVRACAGLAVSRVTTVLRPERMIVSQRFAVR